MLDLGTLRLKLEVDRSDADKELSGLATSANKMLSTIKTAIAALGVAAVAKQVVDLGKSALDAYANYEQLVGGVETLFGAGGQSIEEYAASVGKSVDDVRDKYNSMMTAQTTVLDNADKAYKTAGLSANDYMETVTSFSASLIQSLGGDTEKAASYADRAIVDMSDNANKMGTSMESIQNAYAGFAKQNYTMLDNLKLGYGGTKSEMERLIADAAEMTDVQKELGVTVDASSLSFDNIVNAISVMQESMGIAGTTAKEAATTIEGSVNSMKASWENWLTELGKEDADIKGKTQELVESIVTVVKNVGPRIAEIATNMVSGFAEIIVQLGAYLIEQAPTIIQWGVDLISNLKEGFAQSASTLAEAFGKIAPDLLNALKKGLEQGPTVLVETITKLVTSIIQFFTEHSGDIINVGVELINSLVTGIINAIPSLLGALPQILTAIMNFISTAAPQLVEGGANIIQNLANGIKEGLPKIVEKLPEILTTIVTYITTNIPTIIACGVQLIEALAEGIIDALPTVIAAIPQIIVAILAAFVESLPQIVSCGAQIIESLFEGILSLVSKIPSVIGAIASGIIDGFKNLFGIHSPSTVMSEMGVNLVEGLLQGLENTWNKITEFFSKALEGIKTAVSEAWTSIKDKTSEIWGNIKDKTSETWTNIKEKVTSIATDVKDKVSETWASLKDKVSEIGNTLKDKITETWTTTKDKVTTLATNVKDKVSETWSSLKDKISTTSDQTKEKISTTWENIKSTVTDKVTSMKDSVATKFSDMKSKISDTMSSVKTTMTDKWNQAVNAIKSTNLSSAATSIINGFKNSLQSAWNGVTSWANNAVSKLKSSVSNAVSWVSSKVRGHRTGLAEVPYDGYAAILHKGERVLTAAQNNQYNKLLERNAVPQPDNVTVNFNGSYSFRSQEDIDYFMNEAGKLIKRKAG